MKPENIYLQLDPSSSLVGTVVMRVLQYRQRTGRLGDQQKGRAVSRGAGRPAGRACGRTRRGDGRPTVASRQHSRGKIIDMEMLAEIVEEGMGK